MLLKIVYVLTWRTLGLVVVLFRGDRAIAAEVLVLRHENTILRWHRDIVRHRQAARSVRGRTGRPVPPEYQGPGPPAGPGEPRMGLPPDPRGTGRPGSASLGVDGVGDLDAGRNRPRAAADRTDLVAVPALPGRGDPGMRLLHRRPARRHPGSRAGRDGARDPAHPHPRHHPAPDRGMDHAAGPQPAHGPRRPNAASQVHDPRPRL